jgi:putative ABC transport system permease protein
MPDFRAIVRERLLPLALTAGREQQIVDELATHLEETYESLRGRGLSEEAAWEEMLRQGPEWAELRRALLAEPAGLGTTCRAPTSPVTDKRRTRISSVLERLAQDLRYAQRQIGRTPAFTAVAVVTLGLGLGATTAMFTVIQSVLLRPLAIAEPNRVVQLDGVNSIPNLRDVQKQTQSFTSVQAYRSVSWTLMGAGDPESLAGSEVEAGMFELLGVPPLLGRTFRAGEDEPEAAPVAVLAEGLWRRRFGADSAVLGQAITLNERRYTVIGVMPASFGFPLGTSRAEFYVPLLPDPQFVDERGYNFYANLARLAPGATLESANAELAALAERLTRLWYPDSENGLSMAARPIMDVVSGDIRPALLTLFGAVGMVLLITCVNVSNLLLARFSTRRQGILVRVALGASRARLVRQFLLESLLLAVGGGVLGLLLAAWTVRTLAAMEQLQLPRLAELGLDGAVFSFTAVVTASTALLSGLVPALRATGAEPRGGLQLEPSRGVVATRRPLAALLVGAEVALALILLTGAGLLLQSYAQLRAVDPGFETDNVLTLQVTLPADSEDPYLAAERFMTPVREQVLALPGVGAAGWTNSLPLRDSNISGGFSFPSGVPATSQDTPLFASYRDVSAGYFDALGIPIVRGRAIDTTDRRGSLPAVVVDEAFADRFFGPDADALGKQIVDVVGTTLTIVGIAGNVRQSELSARPEPHIYRSAVQIELPPPTTQMTLAVRGRLDPAGQTPAIRRAVTGAAPNIAISNVETMRQVVAESITDRSLNTAVLGIFAAVALALVATGIYGVLSFLVCQRKREISLRLALGATPQGVTAMVIGTSLRTVAAGTVFGIVGALAAARLLQAMLFGVSAHDAVTLAAVSVLILAVATLASWLPARRAAAVDPADALRSE